MRHALAKPNDNPAFHRFYLAYQGDQVGLHEYFSEALRQANSSVINCEAGEGLSFELETIVRRIGDCKFAKALSAESPETRSAVASFLDLPGLSAYPRTSVILKQAPNIDYPLYRAYRGDKPNA